VAPATRAQSTVASPLPPSTTMTSPTDAARALSMAAAICAASSSAGMITDIRMPRRLSVTLCAPLW
jgi:hypothetical protein